MIISLAVLLLFLFFYFKNKDKCILLMGIWFPTLYLFSIGRIKVFSILVFIIAINLSVSKWKKIASFPCKYAFLVCITSYIMTNTIDNHPRLLAENLSYYIFPLILWVGYNDKCITLHRFIIRNLLIYCSIISLYGICEALTASNPILNMLRNFNVFETEQRADYFRFGLYRAQSLTIWCSCFGTVCCFYLLLLLHVSILQKKRHFIIFNSKDYLIMTGLFVCVFICGTRSVISMFAISTVSFIPYFYTRTKKIIIYTIPILVLLVVFPDFFNNVYDSFVHHEQTGGSSIELREIQLEASLFYLNKSYLWGNGLGYVGIAESMDNLLYGAESIIFKVMIDRGIVGLVSIAILWISMLIFVMRKLNIFGGFLVLGFALGKLMSALLGIPETYTALDNHLMTVSP